MRTLQKRDQERDITVVGQGGGHWVAWSALSPHGGREQAAPWRPGVPQGQRRVTGSCGYISSGPAPAWRAGPVGCSLRALPKRLWAHRGGDGSRAEGWAT